MNIVDKIKCDPMSFKLEKKYKRIAQINKLWDL